MQHLSLIDYFIIGGYFALLIGIGRYLKRRASQSLADYFLGGRKMPWWLLGISGMAAWVDMTGTMIITSFLFMLGPRGLFIEFRGGAGIVLIFILLWLGKWHRRSGCLTLAEWMVFRFGDDAGGQFARLACAVSSIIFTIGLLAYSFVGAGLFLSMFIPFPPWACSLILLVVTIIYTMEAGFYGVVVADVFQMGIFVFAAVFIAVMAISKTGASGETIAALALDVTGNTSWMSSVPSIHTTMPAGYEAYTGLMTITIFYLIKTIIQGMGLGGEPKFFGARNDRECGLLSFLCGNMMAIRWFLMMGFVVLGLFLIKEMFADQAVLSSAAALIKEHVPQVEAHKWAALLSNIMNHPKNYPSELINGLQNILGSDWVKKLSLLSFEGTVDTERILPAVLFYYIPVGVKGLILVALLAAAMSTFNAFINMTTGFFTNDIYKRYLRPNAANKELIYMSYAFGAILIFISFAMAYSTKNINHIWGWLSMGLAGGLIIPLTLRLYWWRFNGSGFAVGTCCGVIAAIAQRFIYPNMDEWLQFVVVTSIGLIFSIVGTYLTPPADKKILENFYLKTRPFGFWKPFEHLLGKKGLKVIKKEHFYDIISLPFVFFWQVSILLVPMQLLVGAYKSSTITVSILVVSLIGMYFFWYKRLPTENFEFPAESQGKKNSVSETISGERVLS